MNRHLVNTCKLDIGYNNEKTARALQARVSQIFHATLSRTIHEVLDAFDTNNSLYIIDKLEIDLGEIKEAALDQELPHRLKEKLTEILHQSDITQTSNHQPKVITTKWSAEQQYIHALEIFLLTGQMPWQYRNIAAAYPTFIDKILADYSAALATLVTKHISDKIFLERLVNQFGSTNIERLVHILAPHEATVVIETVHHIQEVEIKEKILAIPRHVFQNDIWQLALLYLVKDRGTYFNTKDFIQSVIKGLAARNNVDFVQYLQQIHHAVQYQTLYHTFRYSFPNILEELYNESVNHTKVLQSAAPETPKPESALYDYLSNGFLSGQHLSVSRNDLEAFIKQDRHPNSIAIITTFLYKHIRHDNIRRRTILLIKEEGAKKVVAYIEPANSQFIFSFVDKLQKDHDEKRLNSKADASTFKIIKWDFIIATLLTNRGSVFNTRAFVISTVQSIANRYGHDFEQLLTLIVSSIPDHTQAPSANNFIAALRQIKNEHSKANPRNASPGNPSSAFKQLTQQLCVNTKPTAQHKKEILTLFTTLYTWPNQQLIAWLEKKIADGVIAIDKILADASLAKKLSALSKSLAKALDHADSRSQQAIKKNVTPTGQLLQDLHVAINKLSDTTGSSRRALSRKIYQWLTHLVLTEPEIITARLLQQLSAPAFQQNIWLTENESEILQHLIPSAFAGANTLYTIPILSKKNSELYLSVLQYYAVHQSLPWWATELGEHEQHIDHIVLTLLKHRSSQTKEALILIAKDEQKRNVLLTALSSKTITTIAHRLGNMQQRRLEYFLNLIDQVNKEQHPVHTRGQSFKPDQWGIILEALLQERGSRFNLKAFLKTTLKKFAAHFNRSYAEMLELVNQLIEQSKGSEKKNFESLLNELNIEQTRETEQNKTDNTAQPDTSDANNREQNTPQQPKPFWQHLLQNLKDVNTPAGKITARKELHTILQQLDSQSRAELLSTLRLLNTSGYRWPTLWSLLDDTTLAHLFAILTTDALFVKSYLTDWNKIMLQHFNSNRNTAERMFYELTLTYSILYQTIDKHRWFSFLLTSFETYFNQKLGPGILKNTVGQHFNTTHSLLNSTINLSFKKWIEASPGEPLHEQPEQSATADNTKEQPPRPHLKKPPEKQKEIEKSTQDQWIQNCGLVLIWPFMERYFTLLDLLENRQFKSAEHAHRAVHLLQYLVTGQEGHPEYQLVLNKMLCNVNTAEPIIKDLELTDQEKSLSENLLKGVIQNWSILGNTSVEGLRTTFLMRDGVLKSTADNDTLHVENKTFDVLIDKIPWGYTTVKLPWMERPIYVIWR